MSCEPIRMQDGTVVLANVKPGETLTEEDKRVIAEWVEFCRERARKKQRERNQSSNPTAILGDVNRGDKP